MVWNLVTRVIVMPLALAVTGSTSIFRYLRRSVLDFDGVRASRRGCATPGSSTSRRFRWTAGRAGITHTFRGRKPAHDARRDIMAPAPRRETADPLQAVVVGGGLAGVAAATVLGERGVAVTLLERRRSSAAGRAAWTDTLADGTPFEMERGFHAFFRQYHNLRALLRRVDPELAMLEPLEDYPILGPGGMRVALRAAASTALERRGADEAHADADVARSPARERPRCARDAPVRSRAHLRAVRRHERPRLSRLARVPARRTAHALRRLLALLLQPGVGDVGRPSC
jgi:hypothetical protein